MCFYLEQTVECVVTYCILLFNYVHFCFTFKGHFVLLCCRGIISGLIRQIGSTNTNTTIKTATHEPSGRAVDGPWRRAVQTAVKTAAAIYAPFGRAAKTAADGVCVSLQPSAAEICRKKHCCATLFSSTGRQVGSCRWTRIDGRQTQNI